ncbi:MAG: acyltransferase family protein [Bacteroidota bacterium]|nr:acyltransferase family protein [Bacteroidota bacterium]
MKPNNVTYRADIDGLRALAVISVIIFHINPLYMPSGFLGVDIFFVISGYLITSILCREMSSGTFSFMNFYNRRIKRILPVFFVVLITSILLCWWLFTPNDLIKTLKSAVASVLFVANFYFARNSSSLGYFDPGIETKPFVHIWSLSVEEQFYFIFPLLLLLMFRINCLKKNKLMGGVILSAIIIATQFLDLSRLGFNWDIYYLPHLRMIEMMTGSFLAVYVFEKGNPFSKKQSNILGLISIIVLTICLFLTDFFVVPHFPGYLSLLPCIATALLIISNEKGTWVKRLFSIPIVVWIGKLSYSLYLWHWVILAIFRYFLGEGALSTNYLLVAIALMFVLSVLSYYFVEQTTRHNKMNFYKNLIVFYLLPSVIVLGFYWNIKNLTDSTDSESLYPSECHAKVDNNHCTLGNLAQEGKTKILFVGDSHTGHLAPFVDIVGKNEGWKADLISTGGCPCLTNYDTNQHSNRLDTKDRCQKLNKLFLEKYDNYDIIVFSNYFYETLETYTNYLKELETTIQFLSEKGKKVYVIRSSIFFGRDMVKNGLLHQKIGLELPENTLELEGDELAWRTVKQILNKYPNVTNISLVEYIPKDGVIDGKLITPDEDHLNIYGSKKLAEFFIKDGKKLIKEEDLLP